MKILYVLGSFFPAQAGGPNNTIYWASKALVKNKQKVTVVSLFDGISDDLRNQYDICYNKRHSLHGIEVYYFSYALHRLLSFRMYIWLLLNIRKYDLVNLNSYFFPITWVAALICCIFRVPFSLAPRGELEDNAIIYNRRLKVMLSKMILKYLYSAARFVLVTSEQEKKFSLPFFRTNMQFRTIPNYQDLSEFDEPCSADITTKAGILYLGRIHPKKNIESLIYAFDQTIDDMVSPGKLIIAGKGDDVYLQKLKAIAKNKPNIEFVGHVEGEHKELLLKSTKVLVLPSHSENYGNVVIEALKYGTPVIASKFTPWNVLEKFACGKWVLNTPESLNRALFEILSLNQEQYLKMARNSYKYAKEYCDVNKNIFEVIRVFKEFA